MTEREFDYRLAISYAVFYALMTRMRVKQCPARALDLVELLHQGK